MKDREIYLSLIRLHILYCASQKPIDSFWMRGELTNQDYHLTPSNLYTILQGMQKNGYLEYSGELIEKNLHRLYQTTAEGNRVLAEAKLRVTNLLKELSEKKTQTE